MTQVEGNKLQTNSKPTKGLGIKALQNYQLGKG